MESRFHTFLAWKPKGNLPPDAALHQARSSKQDRSWSNRSTLRTCACRYWARRRGIYSNIVGFFGGTSFASNADWLKLQCCAARKLHASMFLWLSLRRITWSLLVARICQRLSNSTEEFVPFDGRSDWRSAISILCAQPISEQAQRWAHVLHFSLCKIWRIVHMSWKHCFHGHRFFRLYHQWQWNWARCM